MGKSLVIKGADFSANGIPEHIPALTWYIDSCINDASVSAANKANGGWAYFSEDNALLQGKTINRIKLIPSLEGTLNIYSADSLSGNKTLRATITILEEEKGNITTYSFQEFTLGANEIFVIGEANTEAGFKYRTTGGVGFYGKVPSASISTINGQNLNISVGYYG